MTDQPTGDPKNTQTGGFVKGHGFLVTTHNPMTDEEVAALKAKMDQWMHTPMTDLMGLRPADQQQLPDGHTLTKEVLDEMKAKVEAVMGPGSADGDMYLVTILRDRRMRLERIEVFGDRHPLSVHIVPSATKETFTAHLSIIDEPGKQESRKAPFWMEWYQNTTHLVWLFLLSESSSNPFTQEEGRTMRRLAAQWFVVIVLSFAAGYLVGKLQ